MISLRHLRLNSCGYLKLKIYETEVIISVLTSPQKTPTYPLSCFLLQWNVAPSFLHPNRKSRSHRRLFYLVYLFHAIHLLNIFLILQYFSFLIITAPVEALIISPLEFGNVWCFRLYFYPDHFVLPPLTVLYVKWDRPTRPMKLKSQEGRGRWKSLFLLGWAGCCSMWLGLRINAGLEKFQMS